MNNILSIMYYSFLETYHIKPDNFLEMKTGYLLNINNKNKQILYQLFINNKIKK